MKKRGVSNSNRLTHNTVWRHGGRDVHGLCGSRGEVRKRVQLSLLKVTESGAAVVVRSIDLVMSPARSHSSPQLIYVLVIF